MMHCHTVLQQISHRPPKNGSDNPKDKSCISSRSIACLQELLAENRCWSCQELVRLIGTSALTMRNTAAQQVPYPFSNMQMWRHLETAHTHLLQYPNDDDTFLDRIIGSDKTWACTYEVKLRQQSSEWQHLSSPWPKKFKQEHRQLRVTLITMYDHRVSAFVTRSTQGDDECTI